MARFLRYALIFPAHREPVLGTKKARRGAEFRIRHGEVRRAGDFWHRPGRGQRNLRHVGTEAGAGREVLGHRT